MQAAETQEIQPGREYGMQPEPKSFMEGYLPAAKLKDMKALVTGGDSGIGRATSIAFALEGADVAIVYYDEDRDAKATQDYIERNTSRQCILIKGDVGDQAFCQEAVDETAKVFGKIDILVNNAAEQHPQEEIEDITAAQLEQTFRTNVFSQFYLTKAALAHMAPGSRIINTTSVTAYRGHSRLIDYASTKGAITSFTRSLSQHLAEREIRVNGVAPGPIWTPLIPSTFDENTVEDFGEKSTMGRVGQPDEVAPSFVFLASDDSQYMTGQVLHPNGGAVING